VNTTKKEDEENGNGSEEEDEDVEKSVTQEVKLDTSELTKAVEGFTAAVDKMAALLAKEDEDEDEEDNEEKSKKSNASKEDDDNGDDDDDDSEEKAKKAMDVLKEQGYKVEKLLKGGPVRPTDGARTTLKKAVDSDQQPLVNALDKVIAIYNGGAL
jgi:hypothetical protein